MQPWITDAIMWSCLGFFVIPEIFKAKGWIGRVWWTTVSLFYIYVIGINKWW